MKCPKCHYLSFDPEPRCRNCGYTLELVDADLAITPADDPLDEPVSDLTFRVSSPGVAPDASDLALRHDDPVDAGDVVVPPIAEALPPGRRRRRSAAARGPFDAKDLAFEAAREEDGQALMDGPAADDDDPADVMTRPDPALPPAGVPPITTEPATPMPRPMYERRAVSETPGWADEPVAPAASPRRDERPLARPVRPEPAPPTTELPLFVKAMPAPDVDDADVEAHDRQALAAALSEAPPARARVPASDPIPVARPRSEAPRKAGALDRDLLDGLARLEHGEREARRPDAGGRVGIMSRLGAAVIDALLLGGLSAALVWATLRWCGLPLAEARILPILPTAAFLVVVGLGYLLLFTAAGGQTVGKMVCGIRVVDEAADELPLRQALYREVVAVPSVLALGLGFFPALVGEERALHDRLAHTRVVRA